MVKYWRIWAKALGSKEGKNNKEADIVATIRTLIFLSYLTTNVAIIANAVRHWEKPKIPQSVCFTKRQ